MHINNRAQSKGSAAWVLGIVVILMFLTGALILTATDPLIQALFNSPSWNADTTHGANILMWMEYSWAFMVGAAILLAILFEVWISTRQPQ